MVGEALSSNSYGSCVNPRLVDPVDLSMRLCRVSWFVMVYLWTCHLKMAIFLGSHPWKNPTWMRPRCVGGNIDLLQPSRDKVGTSTDQDSPSAAHAIGVPELWRGWIQWIRSRSRDQQGPIFVMFYGYVTLLEGKSTEDEWLSEIKTLPVCI